MKPSDVITGAGLVLVLISATVALAAGLWFGGLIAGAGLMGFGYLMARAGG